MTFLAVRLPSLRALSACLMALSCANCSTSPAAPKFLKPTLPAAPETFGQPVPVPLPVKGQSAVTYSAKVLGALASANQRLANDGAFYKNINDAYEARSEP